jgi:hypothetical protein
MAVIGYLVQIVIYQSVNQAIYGESESTRSNGQNGPESLLVADD